MGDWSEKPKTESLKPKTSPLPKSLKVIYNRKTWGCKGFDVLAKAAL
jgi:hypothetical protein